MGVPTRASSRRALVRWPAAYAARFRATLRVARPSAEERARLNRRAVGTTVLPLSFCVMRESTFGFAATARLPSAGCTIFLGRSSLRVSKFE